MRKIRQSARHCPLTIWAGVAGVTRISSRAPLRVASTKKRLACEATHKKNSSRIKPWKRPSNCRTKIKSAVLRMINQPPDKQAHTEQRRDPNHDGTAIGRGRPARESDFSSTIFRAALRARAVPQTASGGQTSGASRRLRRPLLPGARNAHTGQQQQQPAQQMLQAEIIPPAPWSDTALVVASKYAGLARLKRGLNFGRFHRARAMSARSIPTSEKQNEEQRPVQRLHGHHGSTN